MFYLLFGGPNWGGGDAFFDYYTTIYLFFKGYLACEIGYGDSFIV